MSTHPSIHPSVCLSKYQKLCKIHPHCATIMLIDRNDHNVYRPLCSLTIVLINHCAHQPSCSSTIMLINHYAQQTSPSSNIMPISHLVCQLLSLWSCLSCLFNRSDYLALTVSIKTIFKRNVH